MPADLETSSVLGNPQSANSTRAPEQAQEYVEYDSNNSGGHWWLTDEDWFALERAGWKIAWKRLDYLYTKDERDYVRDADGTPKLVPLGEGNSKFSFITSSMKDDGRWLGALASKAFKPNCGSIREAADEWRRITGKSPLDAGCACCGQPHRFTLYRDGKYIESGPDTFHEARWGDE